MIKTTPAGLALSIKSATIVENVAHSLTPMAEFNSCNEGFGTLERSERPVLTQGGGGLMLGGPFLTFPSSLPQVAALWRQNLTTVNMAHTHCSHVG